MSHKEFNFSAKQIFDDLQSPFFSQVMNFAFGPVWAANCRGFLHLINGDPIGAVKAFKEALPALSGIFGGTRPHLTTASVFRNLGHAAFLTENGFVQSLKYFGRFV